MYILPHRTQDLVADSSTITFACRSIHLIRKSGPMFLNREEDYDSCNENTRFRTCGSERVVELLHGPFVSRQHGWITAR